MMISTIRRLIFLFTNCVTCFLTAESFNQTPTTTVILPNALLPFEIKIDQADFSLPAGLHSFVYAPYNGKWLFIAGRANGMHTFDQGENNFAPSAQNQNIFLVDPIAKTTVIRSLTDPTSGLTQEQIDTLSVSCAQFYTEEGTLYITGGYGFDTPTGSFTTKDTLTAIHIPGLIHWMTAQVPGETASAYIRQIHHPIFQVTGGYMTQFNGHATLLVMGQKFSGFHHEDSNGIYTEKVRRFNIIDDGVNLSINVRSSVPKEHERSLRRRNLNVVPILFHKSGRYRQQLIAYSGVFTMAGGIWTVPVVIEADGKTKVKDPAFHHNAFKQGMNNYTCPTVGLYSKNSHDMFTVFLGGLSYGYFVGRDFVTDAEIPFINQVTTIQYNKHGHFSQYLMEGEYPVIPSTGSNPGNPLLFGAAGIFIPSPNVLKYGREVLNYDSLTVPTVIGHIVGGIQSTLPNTNVASDSAASPYIFTVTLVPTGGP